MPHNFTEPAAKALLKSAAVYTYADIEPTELLGLLNGVAVTRSQY